MLKDQIRYSRLANITKMINMKLELREVLEHVTTAISEEIVQCNYVGIYLPQEDGTFRGYVGKPETINGWTLDTQVIDVERDLLAREVIETNRTIYIPDTSKDDRPNPAVIAAFQIKSLLALPISFEEELFGLVFLFDYGTPMNLKKSEIQSVEAYLNMAAVAIRNANILTQKENLIAEKQLLLNVTRDLSMCSLIEESLEKCFFYLGKVLNNYNICIHLLDPSADIRIRPSELKQGCSLLRNEWIEIGKKIINEQNYDSVIQIVTKTKKPILIPDVDVDDRLNHDVCRNFSIKSVFIIPLVSMGEVLGIITVVNTEEKGFLKSEPQIRLAQSIVDATASTLSSLLYMNQLENMIDERTKELAVANETNVNVITEKKKYEKELKRLSGLDLIGQMAAGISHEIRNPLTTVRGFLQILNEDNQFKKYNQYINLMVEELDRANSIITEFLSMSNTRTSDLQKLDLNSIIHDMTPLINVDAFNQNKYLKLDTNDIPELLLNRNEIRQLIINLYRNGLEAMDDGKVLTIRTYKEKNCVVLALQDQGEGIRPEVLEKLGTPFFTTKEKGTGLGLGVCYAIAARHNAKIDIQTGPEGTTFFVRFNY